jgi:hypothetical protein
LRFLVGSLGLRLGAVAAVAAIVAGCGGGTENVTPFSLPSSGTVTTSTTSTTALPTLAANGVTVTGAIGIGSIVTTVGESVSSTAPSGASALAAARSSAAAQRSAADATTPTPVEYVTFTASATVTIASGGTLTFALPQLTAGAAYDLAEYTSAGGWTFPVAGPGTVSGSTVTLTPVPGFTLAAGAPVTFALYTVPLVTPTPVASPNSITFDVSSPAPQTVTVTETNNTAPFTGSLACTANPVPSPAPSSSPFVAQLTSPGSSSPTTGSPASFTLQPGSETGTCTLTVTDASNASIGVSVITASSALNVFSTHRK